MTKIQAIASLAGLAAGLLGAVSTATTTQVLADSPWDSARPPIQQSVSDDAAYRLAGAETSQGSL